MLISDIIFRQERHAPDAVALVCGTCRRTYRELAERIRHLARYMRRVTSPGSRVAILSENCPEYVECYYAVPLAGCGLTFLNYRLAYEELRYLVDTVRPAVLIVEHRYLAVAEQLQADQGGNLQIVVIDGARSSEPYVSYEECLSQPQEDAVDETISKTTPGTDTVPGPDELAWLLFTSGTTGRPKGAMLNHRNILAAVINSALSWGHSPESSLLFPWPLYHVAGYAILVSHLRGDAVHLLRHFDAADALAQIEQHRITEMTIAPTMLNMLLTQSGAAEADLSSLRTIYYGSAHMPLETLQTAMVRIPSASYRTGFGMTELSGLGVYLSDADHRQAADGRPEMLRMVGQPMPLTEIRVVDDQDQDTRGDQVGEILVRGDQVVGSYWTSDGPVPAHDPDGWFRTGDLGRWCGGHLQIVDRKKDMIITGGENVYARDVEEAIYAHPAVAEVAVLGLPDPLWGEAVTAVVQLREGHTTDAAELTAHCRQRLAGFKQPRRIVFVDRIPLNPSGKILKRVLREQLTTTEDSEPPSVSGTKG